MSLKNVGNELQELDFHFETEGDVGDYEKERLILAMEKVLFHLLETRLYDIRTFMFEVSSVRPVKNLRKKNRKHGLFVQYYNDRHQGFDLFFSWNGCREMNFNSRYLMSEFNKENGIIEFLQCSGYVINTIDFELRTIKKFY